MDESGPEGSGSHVHRRDVRLRSRVIAVVPNAGNVDAVGMAVSRDGSGSCQGYTSDLDKGRHIELGDELRVGWMGCCCCWVMASAHGDRPALRKEWTTEPIKTNLQSMKSKYVNENVLGQKKKRERERERRWLFGRCA